MVDIKGFRALCDKRGISLVEDCAQSHGASRDGIQCGQLGDAAAFSFYPTKNLGACGEGGMVLSRHAKVIEKARRIREHGSPVRYTHSELGTNSRMQGLQGAALNCKLPHLNAWNARRAEIAARYDAVLKGNAAVIPLTRRSNTVHAYHQYTVRIVGGVSRDAVLEKLKAQSIFAQVHYPSPVHLQEAAKPWGYCPGDFPNAERLAREVICLPVHPFLSNSDADRVAGCLLTASLG
jgi:dTDP-4-amino-4,6-dideoxygalactose transaminase